MPLEWSPSSTVTSYSHILYFCCSLYIDNINSQNILHVKNSLHFSYPDVMMPSYNRSRWFVIYFAVYISVTLYFLMNLVRRNSTRLYRLWQYIEVFCVFHLTVQSPKLKVACNNFFCSQPKSSFYAKYYVISWQNNNNNNNNNNKAHSSCIAENCFQLFIFCKIISIFE